MKRKTEKKLISAACAVFIAFSASSCAGRNPGGETLNKDMTQLNIGVFEGGLGSDWVYALKKSFEEKYADVSFEPNKKGVQLQVSESKSFSGTFGTEGTVNMSQDVIFAEGAAMLYCAERGDFLDISDIVKAPLDYDFVRKNTADGGESATIESKLSDNQKAYYSALDNKYYALPTAETYMGIAYDIELFEENNLFFAPDGTFVKSAADQRSSGPDGDPDTEWDNGLPATYAQFYTLCAKIKQLGMIPVMWGGALQEMVSFLLLSLEADYAGSEQMYLNYDYNGVLKNQILSFGKDCLPVTGGSVNISAANGYELYKQDAKYYALKFLEGIIKNGYYNVKNGTSSSFTHQDAEDVFVSAKYNTKLQRAAMLVDGNWWQSEAKGVFNEWEAEKGECASLQNRKFGMMALPKADESKTGNMTLLTYQGHIGVINSHIEDYKINLAKSFLQYCYTEKALRTYTLMTNICRPVTYSMGDDYNKLSSHGKICCDLHVGANKVSMESSSKINRNYNTEIWYAPNLWTSTVGGTTYKFPSTAMINSGISAEDYFLGLSGYWTKGVWNGTFRNV